MAYETDPIKIPLEVQAEINQIKAETKKVSSEVDSIMSRTANQKESNSRVAQIHSNLNKTKQEIEELTAQLEKLGEHQYIVNPEYEKLAQSADTATDKIRKYQIASENVANTINSLTQKATSLQNVLNKGITAKGLELKVRTDEYEEVASQIVFMREELKRAEEQQLSAQKAYDSSNAVKHYERLESELNNLVQSYQTIIDKQGHLTKEQAQSFDAQERGIRELQKQYVSEYETLSSAVSNANDAVEAANDGLNEAQEEMQSMVENGTAFSEVLTEAGQSMQTNLDSVNAKLEQQNQKQDEVNTNLKEEEEELDRIRQRMSEIEENNEVTLDIRDTDDWKDLTSRIDSAQEKLKIGSLRLSEWVSGFGTSLLQSSRIPPILKKIISLASKLAPALAKALPVIGIVVAALYVIIRVLTGIFNILRRIYTAWFRVVAKIAKTILSGVVTPLKQIPNLVKAISQKFVQLGVTIVKSFGGAIATATKLVGKFFSTIGSGIFNIAQSIGGKLAGLFSSFTSSLTSAFDMSGTIEEIASDYTDNIISARDSAQKELDSYLATVKEEKIDVDVNPQVSANIKTLQDRVTSLDNELKKTDNTMRTFGTKSAMGTFRNLVVSINDLKASLQQLRYAWGAAFAPIASLVIPYLQKFVNWLLSVVNAIAQFIGALTGHATYLRAIKQAVGDSAGGTKKDTKATKDNTKAKKENADAINDQLSGLDDLNVLRSDQNVDSPIEDLVDDLEDLDDLGGVGGGLGQLFEEVPIESKFKEWADKIREMWEKADFTELGAFVGEKLKALLDSIPWEKIQNFVGKLGKSIATFLNGFLEVQGLAESVGRTLGELINTIQIFFTNFVDNFHFESLGAFISKGLIQAVKSIDTQAIGHLFAATLNGLFSTIDGFVKNYDANVIASKVAGGINKAFKDFNWSYNANILSRFIMSLFKTIRLLILKTRWEDLGEDITRFFTHIKWKDIAHEITDGLNELFDGIQRFMDGFDAIAIVKDITNGINEAISNFHWIDNMSTIFNFVYGLFDSMLTAFESIHWGELIDHVFEAITSQPWGNFVDRLIAFFDSGVLQDIATRLSDNIINLDWPEMGHKFVDGLSSVFDTAWEISENFDGAGILHKIVESINTAISDMHDKQFWQTNLPRLSQWLKGLFDALSDALSDLDFDTLMNDIAEGLGNANIPDLIKSFTNFINKIQEALGKLSDAIPWEEIQPAMDALIDSAIDLLATAANNLHLDKLWTALIDALSRIDWTQKLIDIFSTIDIDWMSVVSHLLGIGATGGGLIGGISSVLSGNAGGAVGTKMGEWIAEHIGDRKDLVESESTSLGNAGGAGYTRGYESAFAENNATSVDTWMQLVSQHIDEGLSPEEARSKATTTVSAMDSSFSLANMPELQTFGNNVRMAVTDGAPTNEEMSAIGNNIITGLKQGMLTALSTIATALSPGLRGIITLVQTIFLTHSPSVVMQNIGMNIIQGLINGWQQGIPSMMSAITNFGTQLIAKFNSIKSQVLSVISSMVSSVASAIRNLVSSVSSAVNNIRSAVSNIGSTISSYASNAYNSISSRITIPRHATGQVIPPSMSEYLAILGDNNQETEVVSPLSTMKQAMIEALAEMGGFGGGNSASGDIIIQIDGREVFRAMQTQNSQYKKQTGQSAFA